MAEEEVLDSEQPSNSENVETEEINISDNENQRNEDDIINYLISCENVYYKSQQRGENELSPTEKKEIAFKIFSISKSGFLCRFGKHLQEEHLEYFKQFLSDENDGYAIDYYLSDLQRFFIKSKREKDIKNRRYDALKKLIEGNNYFTETEMMKRNPLLYDQLVGQYLTEDEKKKRDNIDTKNITFVNLLLESIDRDITRKKQKQQEDDEDFTMEEEDQSDREDQKINSKDLESDSWDDEPTDKTTKWGEFPNCSTSNSTFQPTRRFESFFSNNVQEKPKDVVMITSTEQNLLKEEFISIMYQNFLDGKDVDFDYSTVDDNDEFDNLELKTHDAEDSYFDSETPEDIPVPAENEASDDDLDDFMNRLNKHPTVQQLTENLTQL